MQICYSCIFIFFNWAKEGLCARRFESEVFPLLLLTMVPHAWSVRISFNVTTLRALFPQTGPFPFSFRSGDTDNCLSHLLCISDKLCADILRNPVITSPRLLLILSVFWISFLAGLVENDPASSCPESLSSECILSPGPGAQ